MLSPRISSVRQSPGVGDVAHMADDLPGGPDQPRHLDPEIFGIVIDPAGQAQILLRIGGARLQAGDFGHGRRLARPAKVAPDDFGLILAGAASHIPAMEKMDLPDEEWRKRLSPRAISCAARGRHRARLHRRPTGTITTTGAYRCAACGTDLFDSGTKFDSGSGWPSFTGPAAKDHVTLHEDRATAWSAPRCAAPNAAAISATSSRRPGPGRAALLHQLGRARFRAGKDERVSPRSGVARFLLAAVTRRLYP